MLILIFSFSHWESDSLFNHIFSYALISLSIASLLAFFIHAQLNSIKYFNCGQAGDSTHTASGIWHPFWDFFSFGMPGHLITSQIYAKSGILFWSFSFLACRGTRSQARFTRKVASFLGFFLFWHAGAPDHKPDLREKRHPFLEFFVFGMPKPPITSKICAKSGILFWLISFLACLGIRS